MLNNLCLSLHTKIVKSAIPIEKMFKKSRATDVIVALVGVEKP